MDQTAMFKTVFYVQKIFRSIQFPNAPSAQITLSVVQPKNYFGRFLKIRKLESVAFGIPKKEEIMLSIDEYKHLAPLLMENYQSYCDELNFCDIIKYIYRDRYSSFKLEFKMDAYTFIMDFHSETHFESISFNTEWTATISTCSKKLINLYPTATLSTLLLTIS